MTFEDHWLELFEESFQGVRRNIGNLKGITVGFNTNIDTIVHFSSEMIHSLIKKLKVDHQTLLERISQWKGVIETPIDFVTGLCGCFKNGKASEWIIMNEDVYAFLENNLPLAEQLQMGGQTGIMSNILAELGTPLVITHCASLSEAQAELYSSKDNLVIPIVDEREELKFVHPKLAIQKEEKAYAHIISEFRKDDVLRFEEGTIWTCPRSNRFIAAFDPTNSQMTITEGFTKGIEEIAKKSDVIVLSGFHLLPLEQLGIKGVNERIKFILDLINRAKQTNPSVLVQLELCSTKKATILEQLIKLSTGTNSWDSVGSNERELIELLSTLGEHELSSELSQMMTQEKIFEGCLVALEKLSLKRYHLHELGCYIVITREDFCTPPEMIRGGLCFAALIAAHRAMTGEVLKDLQVKSLISNSSTAGAPTKEFLELAEQLEKMGIIEKEEFLAKGIAKLDNYNLIAIPTILIDKPTLTVGLGDIISAATLAGELALCNKLNNSKNGSNNSTRE